MEMTCEAKVVWRVLFELVPLVLFTGGFLALAGYVTYRQASSTHTPVTLRTRFLLVKTRAFFVTRAKVKNVLSGFVLGRKFVELQSPLSLPPSPTAPGQ